MGQKTKIYSAFPGCGKSYAYNKLKLFSDSIVLDSDSSTFDKKYFPDNYINHIKENINKVSIIFVSSHDVVRNSLVDNEIDFTLVYPDRTLKEEYIKRYKKRGNNENFVKLLEENWDIWLTQLENQKNCKHKVLQSGEYISDII